MTIPLPTTGNIEAADLNDMFNAVHTELSDIVTKHRAFDADWFVGFHVTDLDSNTSDGERTFYFYAPDDARVRDLRLGTRHSGSITATVTGTLASVDADDLLTPVVVSDPSHSTTYSVTSDQPVGVFLRKGALYSLTLLSNNVSPVQWVTLSATMRSAPRRV